METPSIEPSSIRSGDTVSWSKDLSADYPANGGWSLVYTLTLQSDFSKRLQVTATTVGATFLATITKAQTAALTAGTYNLFGHVSSVTERHQVFQGTLEVLPDLAAVLTGDGRSIVKRTLDAIQAVIENRASVDQESVSINGRSLNRTPIADLLVLYDRYKTEYKKELNAEQMARTGMNPRKIGVRFARV